MPGSPPPAPFVVGVPRSGTTLLRLLLDAHPDLAIPPETDFGAWLAQVDGRVDGRAALIEALVAWPSWRELGMRREELVTLAAGLEPCSPQVLLRAGYLAYARRHGATRWGDKTPQHLGAMSRLAAAFPEARFLHVVRDGRDVLASLAGLPFAPGDGSVEAIALAWSSGILEARRMAERLPHYREVRFERLVVEPEDCLRELCDELELAFDPAMLLAYQGAAERLEEAARSRGGPAFEPGVLERVRGRLLRPPDPTAAGRWRESLSPEEVRRFEAVAGSTLELLGYGRSQPVPHLLAQRTLDEGSGPLRVVIAIHALTSTGGTQSYVLTVAHQLLRLGHAVTLTADDLGDIAELAAREGIPLARRPEQLPAECDALLVNDSIVTGPLVERYPRARVVHVAHSSLYDSQLPFPLPGVVDAVVVMSERVAARVRATAVEAPIVRLRQPIDTERFVPGPPIRDRPRRALLLGNYLHGERMRALVETWRNAGVECHQVGAYGSEELDVVPQIAAADIVVGKARAALEAMSCARALYVFDHYGGDGWMTPESYPALEADNLAGLATAGPRTRQDLAADLDRYHPDMGWLNLELVRTYHTARQHAAELVEVLRGPSPLRAAAPTGSAEISRLIGLLWRAEMRQLGSDGQVRELGRRARIAEDRLALLERWLASGRVRLGMRIGDLWDRLRPWK